MNVLGVDFGTRNIGLAVGDTESRMAFPLFSIDVQKEKDVIGAVIAHANTEGAERVVVGIPRRLAGAGSVGDTEKAALDFVAALQRRAQMPVDTEDERMTSALVDRWRQDSGLKKKHFDKDAAAAAAILESYLERTARK